MKRFFSMFCWVLSIATPGMSWADDEKKMQELCRAAVEAVDAGWGAYQILQNDLTQISTEGPVCTSRDTAWPKCNATIQELISNNLESLLMKAYAESRVLKLNDLCKQYMYGDKNELTLPKRPWKEFLLIEEDFATLVQRGYEYYQSSLLVIKKLPSGATLSIEMSLFRQRDSDHLRYGCTDITVEMLAFLEDSIDSEVMEQWPAHSICFDLLRQTTPEENVKTLERLIEKMESSRGK